MSINRVLDELERIDQHIITCEFRISEQTQRIDLLRLRGREFEDSETLLDNLLGSLNVLKSLRKVVLSELGEMQPISAPPLG
jgi:hypothetical protein